jgi:iron-sulfur cluster assembly protein
MAIDITDVAAKKVKDLMPAQNIYLRMGVKGGGCSGLSYSLTFESEISEKDKIFEIKGIKVVIDPKSYLYLNGSTLDYVTEELAGGFVFHNPNAKSSCGCGMSFST